MNSRRYRRLLTHVLATFYKPGQRLAVVLYETRSPEERIHCGLCDWPKSSDSTNQIGLVHVFHLKNLTTGQKLKGGSQCVRNYREYLREREPLITIQGFSEAMIDFKKQRSLRARDYGVAWDEWYEEIDEWYDDDDWISKDVDQEILDETYSDETYNYYFGDDDYEDIREREDQ